MRSAVVVGLSLTVSVAAHAQQRDSSYWTLGVSRGLVPTSRFAAENGGSTGSLQVEWRRHTSRLGVRAEVSVAERNQLFTNNFGGCGGCFSDNSRTAAGGLASLVYEWRQERRFRPYVIAGAGIQHAQLKTVSNASFGPEGMVRLDAAETSMHSRLSMVTAAGLGLSANVGRFSGFVESRARTGLFSPNETMAFGLRIRPD